MGLDITYYKNLVKLDCVFDADGEPIEPITRKPIEDYFRVNVNRHFAHRADDLKDGEIFRRNEVREGFRAGSYRGYNHWREQLAQLAGYPTIPYEQYGRTTDRHAAGAWAADSGPFWELINFSDCEGTIGPKTSAKLAADFAQFQAQADAHPDQRFRDLYQNWRIAFETAAQNGAVDFH